MFIPRRRFTEVVSGATCLAYIAVALACAYRVERMLQSYSGAMATIKLNVCRFCGNTVFPKLSIALFIKDGLDRDLPGRISSIVDLPVSREDGLSPYLCRPCLRKFQAAEKFRSIAKSSCEKQGYNKPAPPLHSPVVHGEDEGH